MPQTSESQQFINRRYRLREKLGQGGMGAVYLADDRLTGQTVALKLVIAAPSNEMTDSIDFRLTLANEFKVLASLRHPHIITVIDYGFDEEQRPYFTMELLDGAKSFLEAERNQSISAKADRLIELLQAVAYLHRRNILHRDLKPGNVLVSNDNTLKVLDFGLATEAEQSEELAGTLAYLAPELLQGMGVSEASDLYAIGVMAYELFTGQHPYEKALSAGAGSLINALMVSDPDLTLLSIDAEVKQNPQVTEIDDNETSRVELEESTEVFGSTEDVLEDTLDRTVVFDKDEQAALTEEKRDELDIDVTAALDPTEFMTEDDFDSTRSFKGLEVGDFELTSEFYDTTGDMLTLQSVVGRLLARMPLARYQDAYQVIDDLCQALDQEVPTESAAIRESFLQAAAFVGRETELETLETALEQAIAGKGSSWLIAGESGVGKSRLMDEIRIRALVRGVMVLRGKGVAGGGLSYQIWREPLRRLILTTELDALDASILKDIIPDIAQLIEFPVEDAVNIEGTEYTKRLHGAITSLFQRQALPVVVLFEDLQWLEESLEVLQLLTSMVQSLPILIIGNFRQEDKPDLPESLPEMNLLKLERLSNDGIAQLSFSILGDTGSTPQFIEFLQRETGGNAYFIVEVLRELAEEAGRLTHVSETSLPQQTFALGIKSVIQRRLEKLSISDIELLSLAALIGRIIDLKLLEVLRPEIGLDDWVTTASNYAILEIVDEQWQFVHDKLREVLIEALEITKVRAYHAEIAAAMVRLYPDDEDKAAQIADHWHLAENDFHECLYSLQAGIRAAKLSVFNDAQQYLERALDLMEKLAPEDLAQMPLSKATALFRLAEVLQHVGKYDEAFARAESALSLYQEDEDTSGMGFTYGLMGNVSWYQRNYDAAMDFCNTSLEICREIDNQIGVARALNRIGMIHFDQGDYDTASEWFADCLDTVRPIDAKPEMADVLNNIGLVAYYRGKFDDASNFFGEALTISQDTGERHRAAATLGNLGAIAGMTTKFDEAETYFQESLALSRELGNRRNIALNLNNLGHLAFQRQQYQEAERYLQESWPIAEAIGNRAHVALTLSNIGEINREKGDIDLALSYYREAITIAYEVSALAVLMEILLRIAIVIRDPLTRLSYCKTIIEHRATAEDIRQDAQQLYERIVESMESLPEEADIQVRDVDTIVAEILEK